MNGIARLARIGGALGLTALLCRPLAADGDHREMRVTGVEGTVYLHLHDQPEGQFVEAEAETSLEPGDIVRTGTDGTAELSLDGDSVIEVQPESDFIVNSLGPQRTEFHLGLGSLIAKIKSLLPGQKMEIRTPVAVAAVRGTELSVMQEEGDAAHVCVFDEGHVAVTAPEGGHAVTVGPGQETDLARGSGPGAIHPLRALARHRARIARVRARAGTLGHGWLRRSPAERREARAICLAKPPHRAEILGNIGEKHRLRSYEKLKARQKASPAKRKAAASGEKSALKPRRRALPRPIRKNHAR